MPTALLLLVLASTSPLAAAPLQPGPGGSGRVALGLPSASPSGGGGGALAATSTDTWTPISSLPFTISTSGGYYLTGNLVGTPGLNGITVTTNDVVIDLNGFRLSGATGSLDGIHANPGTARIRVQNGFVTSWDQDGVDLQSVVHVVAENLLLLGNDGFGLRCGNNARIVDCNAEVNLMSGFATGLGSVVERCNSSSNKDDGFALGQRAVVSDCIAAGNNGDGFAGNEAILRACQALANEGHGIIVLVNGHVLACTADQNRGDGIRVGLNSVVRENVCNQNGFSGGDGAGIRATGNGSRIEGNHVVNNDRGIEVSVGNSLVVRNSAQQNGANYAIAAGNSVGPILTASDLATSSNPHANHSL